MNEADDLAASRRAVRHLLDERNPRDALADYYAFHHPAHKTQLFTHPTGTARAAGYVALSRTGMDLFRPLVTLRLPPADMTAAVDLIYQALAPGTAVILIGPPANLPLLRAVFNILTEEQLHILVLDRGRFEPIINVLVIQTTAPNGLPRFVIRRSDSPEREIVASAGQNWQSPFFAEISVDTAPGHQRRGWGRSVVAAMVQYLLENGRAPLYTVAEDNIPSISLAHSVGFIDNGIRKVMFQGALKPPP